MQRNVDYLVRGSSNLVLIALVAIVALLLGYVFAVKNAENQTVADAAADLSFYTELTLNDPLGQPVALNQTLKERSIINFWATWCAPCRREMPALQSFYDQHRNAGVSVIGMTLDDPEPTERFIQEIGVNYPIVMLGDDGWDILSKSGNAKGLLPYTLLIDKQGKVLESKLGEVDLEMLLKWLKNHPITSN